MTVSPVPELVQMPPLIVELCGVPEGVCSQRGIEKKCSNNKWIGGRRRLKNTPRAARSADFIGGVRWWCIERPPRRKTPL